MTNRNYFLAAVALLALLPSCKKDNPKSSKLTEHNAWQISYTGRTVDTSNGVYIVDLLHVESTDAISYYLEVVSADDLQSKYRGSANAYIQANYSKYDSNYLETGDSDASFNRLDDGGGKWVAIAYAIDRNGKLGKYYSTKEFTTEDLGFNATKDWKISVKGRQTITENGQETSVDEVDVTTSSDISYYVDVLPKGYIDEYYNGDAEAYYNEVLDGIADELSDGEDFSGYLYIGNSQTNFNHLDSGDWTAYAIGVDYNGYLTGEYSTYNFSLEQEEATEAYNKWLGTWSVGNYTLNVDAYENNYKYTLSGWESDNEYAAEYEFTTEFNKSTSGMTFFSQYLGYYEYNSSNNYVYFIGTIKYQGESYVLEDEDIDLAYATLSDDNTASVKPANVDVAFDNTSVNLNFETMRFADYAESEEAWHYYTVNVPEFPLTMTKSSDSRKVGDSTGAGRVIRSKAAVRKVASRVGDAPSGSSAPRNSAVRKGSVRTKSPSGIHKAVKPAGIR